MNRAIDAYLTELQVRGFSQSRSHHVTRTLERLLLYLRAKFITSLTGA
jgi:hypothetical protein